MNTDIVGRKVKLSEEELKGFEEFDETVGIITKQSDSFVYVEWDSDTLPKDSVLGDAWMLESLKIL